MSKNNLSKSLALVGLNIGMGLISGSRFAANIKSSGGDYASIFDIFAGLGSIGLCTIAGAVNGAKYTGISAFSEYLTGEYANYVKVTAMLVTDAWIYSNDRGLAKAALVADVISFGLESYIDHQEASEHMGNN